MSHHPTKFGDDRQCGSGDIMVLVVCHVISQDHVIKGFSDFMSRSPSLVAIDTLVLEIK